MKPEDFEKCKNASSYDEFITYILENENLSINDYNDFIPIIFEVCSKRNEKDPFLMYEKILEDLRFRWTKTEAFPYHGPWHHIIIGCILLSSLKNIGYNITDKMINESLKRGLSIPNCACGFQGVCGAGVGLGITISILFKATPFHDKERSNALEGTSLALTRIAKLGGPRCCKLSGYSTINLAIKELKRLGYKLPESKNLNRCNDHQLNPLCLNTKCPYFPRH